MSLTVGEAEAVRRLLGFVLEQDGATAVTAQEAKRAAAYLADAAASTLAHERRRGPPMNDAPHTLKLAGGGDDVVPAGTPPTKSSDGLDRLEQAHRALGESRMIRTDAAADPASVTPEQREAVIDRVRQYLLQHKGQYPQWQIARAIGVSSSVVSQVLSGSYKGDAAKICIALDGWLERRVEADATTKVADFVWTGVARQIRLAAKRAISAAEMDLDSRIGLVTGDPGCGKTKALQAIQRTTPGAILITLDFHAASPTGVLEKIAKALDLGDGIRGSRQLFDAIVDKLEDTNRLLIVDEIHALLDARDDRAFHTLRHLADQSRAPQLWSSTSDLMVELRKRERKREPLAQITRRIGFQLHLTAPLYARGGGNGGGRGGDAEPLFTVEEIIQIFAKNEMKLSRDAAMYLARLCTSPHLGLLGICTSLVAHTTFANKAEHRVITAAMLWEMHRTLAQPSELDLIDQLMRVDDVRTSVSKVG